MNTRPLLFGTSAASRDHKRNDTGSCSPPEHDLECGLLAEPLLRAPERKSRDDKKDEESETTEVKTEHKAATPTKQNATRDGYIRNLSYTLLFGDPDQSANLTLADLNNYQATLKNIKNAILTREAQRIQKRCKAWENGEENDKDDPDFDCSEFTTTSINMVLFASCTVASTVGTMCGLTYAGAGDNVASAATLLLNFPICLLLFRCTMQGPNTTTIISSRAQRRAIDRFTETLEQGSMEAFAEAAIGIEATLFHTTRSTIHYAHDLLAFVRYSLDELKLHAILSPQTSLRDSLSSLAHIIDSATDYQHHPSQLLRDIVDAFDSEGIGHGSLGGAVFAPHARGCDGRRTPNPRQLILAYLIEHHNGDEIARQASIALPSATTPAIAAPRPRRGCFIQ